MDSKIAAVREECNNRVERYKQMYAEAEKLLDELRTKSMKTPDLVEKINQVEDKMARKVRHAMERTRANVLALTCPREARQTQEAIDKKFVDDMKNVGTKVDTIEKEVVSKVKPEDMMWYNNKYALLQ
jgi:septal ring factor EnvC (AmiA/AmiB activator)